MDHTAYNACVSTSIPKEFHDLLTTKIAFAQLATIMSDGSPQVTPVWFDFDGTHIIINTALGRTKDKNMRREPRVSIAINDPENAYRYVQIRGRVVEMTTDGADAVIDSLAKKYMGVDSYPYRRAEEVRVTVKILPERSQVVG